MAEELLWSLNWVRGMGIRWTVANDITACEIETLE
jgi:hypothetical protein